MRATDIMTMRVITIGPDEPVSQVVWKLAQHNISALPVIDDEQRLLGIVSEGDLMRRPEIGTEKPSGSWWLNLWNDPGDLAEAFTRAHGKCARDVMTAPVITVDPDATLSEIAETLERNHIKRVPVVEDGKLIGLVSRANIIQKLASAPRVRIETDGNDEAMRKAIEDRLDAEPWASSGTTNVTVRQGVVEFWGTIGSEPEKAASKLLASEIEGVKAVVDHRDLRAPATMVVP